MKELTVVMVGPPKGSEFIDLRKTGRGLGVPVSNDPLEPHGARFLQDTGTPIYALETWRGHKAHDLRNFVFPERMVLVTGTTNAGLDESWERVVTGSIYIDQSNWASETFLSVPAAGAMVMWEFHKQRGV